MKDSDGEQLVKSREKEAGQEALHAETGQVDGAVGATVEERMQLARWHPCS